MFDYILFDLDGTLTDPKEGITNCVKYALESYGIHERDENKLLKFIGPPLYDSFREIYGFSHDDANDAVSKYRERFSTIGLFENRLFEDTIKSLQILKENGKKLYLATSKPIAFAMRITEKFDISKYFELQIGSEFDGTRGYKHEVIEYILEQLKLDNLSKIVMIGDRNHDIFGAKKCNIASIGLRCGYAEEHELEDAGADFIFDNLEEATKFLIK